MSSTLLLVISQHDICYVYIDTFFIERDHLGQGFLQDIKLVLHGTEHKPGVKRRKEGKPTKPGYVCHSECEHGCHGPESHQCKQCQNYFYVKEGTKVCIIDG